jgi:dTDP-4-amino-4,6-dideoxygalactose transaminase
MAGLLLDIKPGDEVIIPSFTFVSTANAFALRGAKLTFVDIRPDTLNLDESLLESKITRKTKAIVPVHYAGISCEMDSILTTAADHGIAVVEDNAHGLFGKYRGEALGGLGTFGTQSFHETKNFSCGEGGALLINDERYVARAEILREKGTNRARFFRGQVDKYSWVDIGSSYLPSDILAAFLFAQFEAWQTIQAKRKSIWDRYMNGLKDWAIKEGATLPTVPRECEPSYHLFYVILPTMQRRDAFIAYLKSKKINTVFHYQPLHSSEMGTRSGGKLGDCPVTEHVSDCLVRLPFFNGLSERDQDRVIESIYYFQKPQREVV